MSMKQCLLCVYVWFFCGLDLVGGAPVKLLVNGQAAFDEIVAHLRSASNSVTINMFIWRDDRIGKRLAREVLAAADRGVTVHISKDLMGGMHEFAEESKRSFFHQTLPRGLHWRSRAIEWYYPQQGVKGSVQQQVSPLLRSLLTHPNVTIDSDRIKKDHSKYFIFDNNHLILGGINVEDKECEQDIRGKTYFDYMVSLHGAEVVAAFVLAEGQTENDLRSIQFMLNRRSLASYPIKKRLLALIDNASSSVIVTNAYWGDSDITRAIIAKANAGLDVSVFVADRSNIKSDLNRKVMHQLHLATRGKVKIYLTRDMLHAKAIACDGRQYVIGSSNFNRSSFSVYSESNVLLLDPPESFKRAFVQSIASLKTRSRLVISTNDLRYNRWRAGCERIAHAGSGVFWSLPAGVLLLVYACVRLFKYVKSISPILGNGKHEKATCTSPLIDSHVVAGSH